MNFKYYWQKGLFSGVVLLILGFFYLAFSEIRYDGTCGQCLGLMFIGCKEYKKHECSFMEYLTSDYWHGLGLSFTLQLIFFDYWWALILIVFIPTFIGFLRDK